MNRITLQDINVLTLVKPNGEHYVFAYDNEHRSEALRTLGRFASDQDLSFSWWDAAVLSGKIRDEAQESKA